MTSATGSKPLPADTYVEITVERVAEGQFCEEITAALREAHAALAKRRDRGELGGECVLTATVRIGYDPALKEHVRLVHAVSLRTPKNECVTVVKERGGALLCQLSGSTGDSPDQATGEVHETKEVAGRVGSA